MAAINKQGEPSLSSLQPPSNEVISGLRAGEDIASGDLCTIASNGTAMRHTGDAVHGVAALKASAGESVTLYRNVRIAYGSGLTPGAAVYPSGNVDGGLDDSAGGGEDDPGATAIGFCVDAKRIQFTGL